eukprot:2834726-Alexandrium_andersonii.AAC.1
MHVEAVRANGDRSAVEEAPRGALLALGLLQLHALAVRLEQRLMPHNELGSRFVHEDGRAAGPF